MRTSTGEGSRVASATPSLSVTAGIANHTFNSTPPNIEERFFLGIPCCRVSASRPMRGINQLLLFICIRLSSAHWLGRANAGKSANTEMLHLATGDTVGTRFTEGVGFSGLSSFQENGDRLPNVEKSGAITITSPRMRFPSGDG